MSRKSKPTKFHEDASVLLKSVAGAELRLTPSNRLFIIYNKNVAWPYVSGGTLKFDVLNFELPDKAAEAVKAVLEKQRMIREKHFLDFEEDDSAFEYS